MRQDYIQSGMLSSNLCDQHLDGGLGARTQSEASKENRGLRASSRFMRRICIQTLVSGDLKLVRGIHVSVYV